MNFGSVASGLILARENLMVDKVVESERFFPLPPNGPPRVIRAQYEFEKYAETISDCGSLVGVVAGIGANFPTVSHASIEPSSEPQNGRVFLTLKDVAAAWITSHRCEQWVWFDDDEDKGLVMEADAEKNLLFERFKISEEYIEMAMDNHTCPMAATDIPIIAGRLMRFGDVFSIYSLSEPWEETSMNFLPDILAAENTLAKLYRAWLTRILETVYPDKITMKVSAMGVIISIGMGHHRSAALK